MGKDNKVAGDSAIGQKSSEQGNSGRMERLEKRSLKLLEEGRPRKDGAVFFSAEARSEVRSWQVAGR